jgi:diamine N-acetyltransferase
MPTVELRDIITDADREAALALRRGAGQDRFVASVEKSFADAVEDARAIPRMWAAYDGDAPSASS